jgi:hypothetical protein
MLTQHYVYNRCLVLYVGILQYISENNDTCVDLFVIMYLCVCYCEKIRVIYVHVMTYI